MLFPSGRGVRLLAFAPLLLFADACSGSAGGGPKADDAGDAVDDQGEPFGDNPSSGGGSCEQGLLPAQPRVWLLSPTQVTRGLIGSFEGKAPAAALPAAPSHPTTQWHADQRLTTAVATEHAAVVEAVVAAATADLKGLTGCDSGAGFDDCAKTFIDGFAARAFRTKLSEDQRQDLRRVYDDARPDGPALAVATTLEAVLQAPSFLYRIERGNDRLSGEEAAAALAFFLTDGPPDAALWAAAVDGKLNDNKGIGEAVDRLLEQKDARKNLVWKILAWTAATRVGETEKDADAHPKFTALRAALLKEAELFVDAVAWGNEAGGMKQLLTSTQSFADATLAGHYGIDKAMGGEGNFAAVQLPRDQRSGILTQAATLAALARPEDTSVVRRGLWVWNNLLCEPELPPPPADAVAAAAETTERLPTEVERAAYRKDNSRCSGCHAQFDQLGLLFEPYDTVGVYRKAIPGGGGARVSLTTSAGDKIEAEDAIGLGRALAATPAPSLCLARHVLSDALGVSLRDKAPDESCALRSAATLGGRDDAGLRGMMRALAISAATRDKL